MAAGTSLALAIARHVPAFEAPGRESRHATRIRKLLAQSQAQSRAPRAAYVSVSVRDGELFEFLRFLVSAQGRVSLPREWQQLTETIQALAGRSASESARLRASEAGWTSRTVGVFDVIANDSDDLASPTLALISFRPQPLLPLNMGSARRAVKFVHGVIALVTANAYISTLGGGHFLCMHLHQAKLMARIQIAISDALGDPVLKSKCRVNLAYNAMREGRFRRAQRIIREEEVVAAELDHEELAKICEAAQVYLVKTIKLHQEFLRKRADLTIKERAVVDNFYRQRILRKAK